MTEIIDHETGEMLPAVVRPPPLPVPYNSPETGQLADALAQAQAELESPKRTKIGKIQGTARGSGREYSYEYKYAPFEEIVRVLKAVFPKHGLAYHQGLVTRAGDYFVRTYIRHSSGEWLASDFPVIADKTGPQGFAGATTYAKRYGLSLATGLAAEDDDDGEAAQAAVPDARPKPARYMGPFSREPAETPSGPAGEPIVSAAYDAARNGGTSLRAFWSGLRLDQKKAVAEGCKTDIRDGCPMDLKLMADEADRNAGADEKRERQPADYLGA